ncbi:outer membrane usher protein [Sphingomonas palmae]|uniref:Outer membrane usher protein n=2 Tax=Sphingomonas palmae TaxID=1855283 RepID=A0A1H7L3L3_9SPHN|nr:outer membrane usher protein [Sphingomonas palmae]
MAVRADAQVSVPLPGARRPATPAPTPPPVQQPPVTVPLPGRTPPTPTVPVTPDGRPDINPYHRDIALTVPLTFRDQTLGELPVQLTADSRFSVSSAPFLKLIGNLLNPAARAKLSAVLSTREFFSVDDLASTGVSINFDPGALAIVVLKIEPTDRALESLFAAPRRDSETADVEPAFFSAYVNVSASASKLWGYDDRFTKPNFYLNGASRIGPVVIEGNAQFADSGLAFGNGGYRFDRNFVRAVYDQPEAFRRFYLGDLTPETRGQQTYVQMGGVGVTRSRRRFDPFRSAILQGNRQLVLQRASTVDVIRNGSLLKQFRLDPGSYDLSSLPLLTGSNNVQVQVHDDAGVVQNIAYNSYLDPIDLQPGDYEYGAYFGKTSDRFGRTPVYSGDLAFTGYYRKAFVDRPALGFGLQASSRVQNVIGQTQFILPNSSRLQFDLGLSRVKGSGFGYSFGTSYELLIDRSGNIDSLTFSGDYLSRRYGGLGYTLPDNSSAWSVSAQYDRQLITNLSLLIGASYVHNRRDIGDNYRIDANTAYRFSPKWSVRGGVNYTKYSGILQSSGLGFALSLVYQPSYRDRVEVQHDNSINTTSASYIHSPSGLIDSVGYGAVLGRSLGSSNAQAFANYTGNRFDASISHASFGTDFSHLTQAQATTIQLGTSLAFAGGHFGVGRQVTDSFAILYPHETLKGHQIVAGQSLAENDYLSKSGLLGGAVNGYLTSYNLQSVQYDIKNPPPGYDVGAGVVRIRPPYRSGYALKIGTDAFVSATGTLETAAGKPVMLAGGTIKALDGKSAPTTPFFTNSIGRFAVQNLRPGARYRVELFSDGSAFEISVPKTTTGLVDLKIVRLPAAP